MIGLLPPTRKSVAVSVHQSGWVGFELEVIKSNPGVSIWWRRGADAHKFNRVWSSDRLNRSSWKIDDEPLAAFHPFGHQGSDSGVIFQPHKDVMSREAFT